MPAKVRLISIGYTTAFNECAVKLSVWQEFNSKQKVIDFINSKHAGNAGTIDKQKNLELHEFGCTTIGREHYFILYPDEQNQWIKTLVKEVL